MLNVSFCGMPGSLPLHLLRSTLLWLALGAAPVLAVLGTVTRSWENLLWSATATFLVTFFLSGYSIAPWPLLFGLLVLSGAALLSFGRGHPAVWPLPAAAATAFWFLTAW